MKDEPALLTYLKNTFAFSILLLQRLFLRPAVKGSNILFINTGQIGDLIISSVIFRNAESIKKIYGKIYLLVKKEYGELAESYTGVNVIKWNCKKYKYNILYRVKFSGGLRRLGISDCYNLTAARGVTVDELSLLSGAKNIYALNSNFRYLKKLFGKITDNMYSNILAENVENEFEKNLAVLKYLDIKNYKTETFLNINSSVLKRIKTKLKPFDSNIKIVIAPFTELKIKNWCKEKYIELIKLILETYKNAVILLIGTKSMMHEIDYFVSNHSKRVINLAGKHSIMESAAILYFSNLFIGNDSGFTHIAKALHKPLIGIIGGGSNGYFIPYSQKQEEVYLFKTMNCFKCEWRCIHKKPYCLTDVSVDEVMENINSLL